MTQFNAPDIQDVLNALRREVAELRAEVTALRSDNAHLCLENTALQADNASLRSQNALLQVKVKDLRRRLDKNSSNSSKPPSSDGPGKPPRIAGSLRGKSGKASGGQPGHKGDTLKQVEHPDHIEVWAVHACCHCCAELTKAMVTGLQKRQVFDLPEPRLEVTEHQAPIYQCAACGWETKAAFPEGVTSPVQYGERVKTTAVYLNVQQLIPEDRVAQTMKDLFGALLLCSASIVAWGEKKAEALAGVVAQITAAVAQAPVRHLDETGFRIGGKTQWLHTASTSTLTAYRVSEKRGALPTNLAGGVIVHDHFKPYYTLPDIEHALCNAHHLRELKALMEFEKEPWAKEMHEFLLAANKTVLAMIEQGATFLTKDILLPLIKRYDGIVANGLAFHEQQPPLPRQTKRRGRMKRRPGHNLVLRLQNFKTDVLRFLHDFSVPFTNNLAEQDLRMMKVKMKISGGFRTMAGAQTFATLRSVISTARKRGWNILQILIAKPETLILNFTL